MLTIRLTRKGKKNQPFFRVVVIDKRRSSKGGRPSEILGYVDPLTKRKSFEKDRILHWIKMGAQPSATVHNLLVAEKIIDAPKIKKFSVSKKSKTAAAKAVADAAAAAAAPAEPASAESSGEAKLAAPAAEAPVEAPVSETPAPEAPKEEAKPVEALKEEPKPEEPKTEEKTA